MSDHYNMVGLTTFCKLVRVSLLPQGHGMPLRAYI